jgi:hypothetical protein
MEEIISNLQNPKNYGSSFVFPSGLSEGRNGMKRLLMAVVLLAPVGCAQVNDNGRPGPAKSGTVQPPNGTLLLCKLETVTWNPETEELSWVITSRNITSGMDQPETREKYTIHLDTAVMNVNGEGRRFNIDEAHEVGKLMEMINAYTVESTVGWSKGLGEKVTGKEAAPPDKNSAPSDSKGPEQRKGDQDQPKPALRGPQAMVLKPSQAPAHE